MLSSINQTGFSPLALKPPETNAIAKTGADFSKVIQSAINQTVNAESASNRAIESLNSGESENLHDVMISVEKADISLKMLVQFRNKALQAYDEVMRMQI
jgi:flagellar hook-basal body complex protein FliE